MDIRIRNPLSRREFLRLGCVTAAVVSLGGWLRFSSTGGDFLRPPGARAETEFLGRCLRCQRCMEACPRKVIAPLPVVQGFAVGGTPTLDYRTDYCDLCGKCITACPSGALQATDLNSAHLGVAVIVPDRCVAWNWGGCTVCSKKCPRRAIALNENEQPVVDASVCNGCGLCESICPSASLRSYTGEQGHNKGIVVAPLPL